MAPEKTTIMVLKVDLECTKCCLKVKRLLCRYDQIRDQVFNEKTNTVTITVVCCSPEKIRDKLSSKGRGTIKSIDIKELEKPKPAEPEKVKPVEKPAADPKLVQKPPADKPQEKPKTVVFVDPPKPALKAPAPAPKTAEPTPKAAEPAPKAAEPAVQKSVEPVVVAGYPQVFPSYGMCYEGGPVGPCYTGYGVPMQQPPCNCGCGRLVCYDGYGRGGGGYTVNRCDYFNEENSSGCTVM